MSDESTNRHDDEVAATAETEAERTADEDAGEQVEADLDALLTDIRRERDEYLDLAQRARADFENYRRRATRETSDAERRGRATLAGELLPAIDNLERALIAAGVRSPSTDAAPDGAEPPSQEVSAGEALGQGVALVYDELCAALARAGVTSYDPLGESFDPKLHEALSTRPPGPEEQAGVVGETLQRGYRIDDHVIRPARVVVTEGAAGEGSGN